MPYSKSRSRKGFESNLSKLKSLSLNASYKKTNIKYEHRVLIYQSAIFLASASIEEYIKNFFEDLIFEYKSKDAILSDIPENIRALKLLTSQMNIFKTYVNTGDEARSIKAITKAWDNYDIVDNSLKLEYHIKSRDIIGTKKYPSIKNLKILYNRLGINDIIKALEKKGKKDYKSQLESFLSIREAISHQAAPSLTYTDVKRNFENLSDIINQLDRLKYSQIIKLSGNKFWPN